MTLSPDLSAALRDVAGRRPLLIASDYDGVLSPIVPVPSEAVPSPGVAEALARLAAADGVTVALVSGRGVADLQTVSGFSGPFRWVGSHGAEFDAPVPPELTERRDDLVARLRPLVAAVPGGYLEVKPVSVAVHVRQVADRAAAAELLAQAEAAADSSLTRKPGKEVLELALTAADKGGVVRRLRNECAARAAMYLGDDVTDEDAFRALEPGDVTVKVGDGETAARYRVPDTGAVVELLTELGLLLG
jgi:trehalose 6-phosphate phosphatase